MRLSHQIKQINYRHVLNSHFEWIPEFIVELSNGSVGIGASPKGETLSIFEDQKEKKDVADILARINKSKEIKKSLTQKQLDNYLKNYKPRLGKSNVFALSLAFLNAVSVSLKMEPYKLLQKIYGYREKTIKPPIILCNVLNGGFHAYTNPVLSDFSEYLLVPQFHDLQKLVSSFKKINLMIKKQLQKLPQTTVANNPVHYHKAKDNRVWIEFLLKTLKKLGLTKKFTLMIDASAGDLFSKQKYHLSLTEKKKRSPEEFFNYWDKLLKTYPIQILEDPFAEDDLDNWRQLTQKFPQRIIAGDNLFATNPKRIKKGAKLKLASATLIKPNQIGTISEAVEAIKTAIQEKMLPIISHRSIETESTILTDLTIALNIPIVKIGLFSDFETIIKLNKMLRYDVYSNSS